jgi:hypothetical protein
MARISLVKDGTASDHRTSAGHTVPVETVIEKLTPFEKRFFDNPPDMHPEKGPAPAEDPYRHVVVTIDEDELNSVFPKAGYYHVVGLTAEDACQLFGIEPSS